MCVWPFVGAVYAVLCDVTCVRVHVCCAIYTKIAGTRSNNAPLGEKNTITLRIIVCKCHILCSNVLNSWGAQTGRASTTTGSSGRQVRRPQSIQRTWTVLHHDGPDHLGLLPNALPRPQNGPNHLVSAGSPAVRVEVRRDAVPAGPGGEVAGRRGRGHRGQRDLVAGGRCNVSRGNDSKQGSDWFYRLSHGEYSFTSFAQCHLATVHIGSRRTLECGREDASNSHARLRRANGGKACGGNAIW